MACVLEPMSASARQNALRAQAQPGAPPRPLDPPCSAWLLLEKDEPLSDQVSCLLEAMSLMALPEDSHVARL